MTNSTVDATTNPSSLPREDIDAIIGARHGDPFAVLGLHDKNGGGLLARCLIPGAETVEVETLSGEAVGTLTRLDDAGFFEGPVTLDRRQPIAYRAANAGGSWRVVDPYCFGPVLGPMDDYLIREGSHLRLFDKMGAHPLVHEGVDGFHFAVWAPNAQRVSVVGDFNGWDGRRHVMRLRRDTGIWEIFLPDVTTGAAYKFEILGPHGELQPLKADPYARRSELRPATASVTAPVIDHDWKDAAHRAHWSSVDARRQPISIYEVHAGSWQKSDTGDFLSWDELGDRLIPYCVDMGFTHIEFLPISEYPYDPSWGYQTTGLYAPTARFGEPEGLARFVDGAHKAGIGVILDWVPAHFPVDAHGLRRFDGTALYEHEDPRQGFHPDWNTAIYNFGRAEVFSYLVNNALYWAETFHLDGLRVDAVASMLYLDYSRKHGEWVPNEYGGNENLEAVRFLQTMNRHAYGSHPGILTIAEESTSWPKVSAPVHDGGLGFGFKWNMGFMHDTLQYLSREPVHRKYHHHDLTFGLVYAFSENFVLPLSHDEVVHGKGSLIAKMAGDDWQKFANLRAYYGFMWGYPGKKLLFMGQEFAQWSEWSHERGLDWNLLEYPLHRGMHRLVRDLNGTYRAKPSLHARDCEGEGFEWLIADDRENSVFAWLRKAPGEKRVAVVSNFTPVYREHYSIPLPKAGRWREILNTDAEIYGGSGKGNGGSIEAKRIGSGAIFAAITLPPLATVMFEEVSTEDEEDAPGPAM
ncbi:1,4-alpha-glucan branching enzyme [Xaviernesmea oryzae]|uniref:1,4-alpha-glucan branching enzyme GlgB n=1 Tax=Xaviernesmea oryzae TaxID=464029 RepID=A0A1Q9AZ99_9HYPH|nr:1,4-alpha-glucan branching protein GlgB [Xaviernesmea oryzae]OLP61022.1 1,4-alpha-glucan branching enzyme [Xaviernesmea oryzae]SEL16883.1 1,4-alpha-glucan branching enzyme [Xaviernesmea oryzae]